jgi:hypothetical protein
VLEAQYRWDPESLLVKVAREWRDALACNPADTDSLAALARRAEELKHHKHAGIVFFFFCNDMVAAWHLIWEDFLTQGTVDEGTRG